MPSKRFQPSGFTLIEMLTVISIIAVLAAIIFPVMGRARAKGRQTVCASNLKQIGVAIGLYAQDNDNRFPDSDPLCYSQNWQGVVPCDPWAGGCSAPSDMATRYQVSWQRSIFPYVKENKLYVCPSARTLKPADNKTGYAINGAYWRGARKGYVGTSCKYAGDPTPCMPDTASAFDGYRRTTKVADPSGTLMVMDSSTSGNYQVGESSTTANGNEHPSDIAKDANQVDSVPDFSRHNNGLNCLFADGHGKWENRTFVYEKSQAKPVWPGTSSPTWQVDRHWTMEDD